MHTLSDGQRQSVQIAMGLLKPFDVLLLDEVTVDVDVLARRNLMAFLKRETEQRNATVLYATHVFDSLGDWPTHILHIGNGRVRTFEVLEQNAEYRAMCDTWNPRRGSPLSELIELWLQREYDERLALPVEAPAQTVEQKLCNDKSTGDRFYNYGRDW